MLDVKAVSKRFGGILAVNDVSFGVGQGEIVGVIVAVVIAWFLVDVIFKLAWLIAKLGMVAIVAVVVAPRRLASGPNTSPPTSGIHSAE